jgi:hypothetical protein
MAGLAEAQRYGTLFWIGAAVTLPVVVIGTIGRWRFPEHDGGSAADRPIDEGITS